MTGEFFEQRLLDYIRLAYPTQRRILDIGANFGNHTVFFDAFVGCTAIDAFEPQSDVFGYLTANTEDKARVNCHNIALGERESVGVGDVQGPDNRGTFRIAEDAAGNVPIKTLDSFGFHDVTLMKIDVEWMELEVLKGAVETIKRCRPVIFLEAGTLEYLLPISQFMATLGYRCQWFCGIVPDPPGAMTSLGTTWVLTP